MATAANQPKSTKQLAAAKKTSSTSKTSTSSSSGGGSKSVSALKDNSIAARVASGALTQKQADSAAALKAKNAANPLSAQNQVKLARESGDPYGIAKAVDKANKKTTKPVAPTQPEKPVAPIVPPKLPKEQQQNYAPTALEDKKTDQTVDAPVETTEPVVQQQQNNLSTEGAQNAGGENIAVQQKVAKSVPFSGNAQEGQVYRTPDNGQFYQYNNGSWSNATADQYNRAAIKGTMSVQEGNGIANVIKNPAAAAPTPAVPDAPKKPIPFSGNLTQKQKQSIIDLVGSGRKLGEGDAKNYAFAVGDPDYSKYVGKTGMEILISNTQPPTPSGGAMHTVVRGDTLSGIARKYGVALNDLITANPQIPNPNLIYPNQKITIPEVGNTVNAEDMINKQQNDLKDKLTNAKSEDEFDFTTKKTEETTEETVEETPVLKRKTAVERYNELFNTPEIKGFKSKLTEIDKKIKDIEILESSFERDIRKEVSGEAPESYIQALAASRSEDLYPKKAALMAEKDALQKQLDDAEDNAKTVFQLTLQDEENALSWLKTYGESGIKLSADDMASLDASIGVSGFSKQYLDAQAKAKKAKDEKDELDVMSKIIDMQTKLPAGKSFTIGGNTYESLSDPSDDLQLIAETDNFGDMRVISVDKKTGKIVRVEVAKNVGKVTPTSSTGLDPKTQTAVDSLARSFDSSPIVKTYVEVQNKKMTVDSVLQNGTSGAADVTLVYEFMKALDPTSVVREAEFDTAAKKSGNFFEGIYAGFNGYFKENGGFLPEDVKLSFQSLVNQKYNVIQKQYDNLASETARKINMKTGSSDGADYLTNYDLSRPDSSEIEIGSLPELNQSYKTIQDLMDDHEEYIAVVDKLDKKHPEWTDDEILQVIQSGDFNDELQTSLKGEISAAFPQGSTGGQCGTFAHKIVDFPPVGDSKASKIASVEKFGIPAEKWANDVRVGDVVITNENKVYGHVAVVNEILPDGRIRLSESNYRQKTLGREKVSHDRIISIDSPSIYGAIRGELKVNNLA